MPCPLPSFHINANRFAQMLRSRAEYRTTQALFWPTTYFISS